MERLERIKDITKVCKVLMKSKNMTVEQIERTMPEIEEIDNKYGGEFKEQIDYLKSLLIHYRELNKGD